MKNIKWLPVVIVNALLISSYDAQEEKVEIPNETVAVMRQINTLRRRLKEDDLDRILVAPHIINDQGELSASGFGEISGGRAAGFTRSYLEGESEFMLTLPAGETYRLYFLFRKGGFTEADIWLCNFVAASRDVVVWFPLTEGSIRLKLPQAASGVILSSVRTKIPSETPREFDEFWDAPTPQKRPPK